MEKRKRYGLELDRPNSVNSSEFTDREVVREFIKPLLAKMIACPYPWKDSWNGNQSGNVTVYLIRRSDKMMETALERYHLVIWHGMETYCLDLTGEEAHTYVNTH